MQKFFNYGVVSAQELSGTDNNVAVILFTFSTFSVKELVNRIIDGRLFEQAIHHLKQSFTQMGRTLFRNAPAFRSHFTRLMRWSLNPGKAKY